ncbi:FecR protein [Parapedobacter composti]|uniref:FecR protein n=1 Tax=Parapedobacter composti TaxID=623281 RepID=A0A1I1G2F0_9SPHI|nr:FecR family protein [Parapedobacter composti]SFC03350.1 FecR protein [Parapedobacter composti]
METNNNGNDGQSNRLAILLDRYADKTATPAETAELYALLAAGTHDEAISNLLADRMAAAEPLDRYDETEWDDMLGQIRQAHPVNVRPIRRYARQQRLAAWLGAAAILLLGFGFFMRQQRQAAAPMAQAMDVPPGQTGATLTLADGRKIVLADAATGTIADEGGIVVSKAPDGRLFYDAPRQTGDPNRIHTLATANGQTFRIALSDGTTVWLNAASTLQYPSTFGRQQRIVHVTGEAYFEVASDPERPFIVKSAAQRAQVLGTSFNIAAYPDEHETRTTLTEGALQIVNLQSNSVNTLSPGEQSTVAGATTTVAKAAVAAATSWKAGDFVFENEPLETIMKKLERWYDVEVVYEGDPTGITFYGMVSRNKNIRSVLRVMEMTGNVKFRIEEGANRDERRVVVII